MKRGDKLFVDVSGKPLAITILGPEDSKYYDISYPGKAWELIQFECDGLKAWCPRRWIYARR